jgi:hypothetical protein
MCRAILTIGLILLLSAGATAGTIQVPDDYATIQAGIDAATNGDTVLVAENTYYENIDFKGKAITVASHFLVDGDTTHINNTIINGSQPSDPDKGSVVSFVSGEDTTSVIYGFTITGGTGTLYSSTERVGGGIYCKNSSARIAHNKIVNNSFTHNQSCFGGGIGIWPVQNVRPVVIEDNVIESNSVDAGDISKGGGIFLINGKIIHNIIRQNISQANLRWGQGGGISATCDNINNRPLVIIAENTITSNQAFSKDKTDEKTALGGGVDIQYNNIRLINNTITHNLVGLIDGKASQRMQGGGVRIWGVKDSALVQDNTISFNSFSGNGICAGGGLLVSNSDLSETPARVTITGNRFEGNKGVWGGGLRTAYNPGCVVSDNEFIGNFATDEGGGICDYNSNPFTISNNLFIKNQATRWGGGLSVSDTDVLVVINNIFTENESRCGGGVLLYQYDPALATSARIINNTITANVADSAGGIGIGDYKVISMNTICWGNGAPFSPEILVRGGELNVAHSDIKGGSANIATEENGKVNWLAGNIDANPLFAFPDHQLSNSSPSIGAGIASMQIGGTTYYCPNSDIEGNPRPNPPGSMPDIGAYENPLGLPQGPILVPEQYASIQAGINAARDGDMVLVRDNTYYENINFKGKAITVASYFLMDGDTTHINNTIIDGSKPSHADSGSVVYFVSGEDTTSVLCGFTITNGSGTETTYLLDDVQYPLRAGGGIFCYNSGALIVNNKIINNAVASSDRRVFGGGISALPYENTACVVLRKNQISHNSITANTDSPRGGGVALFCSGILSNNLVAYNSIVHNATTTEPSGGGLSCRSLLTNRRNVILEYNKITHNSIVSKSNEALAAAGGGISIKGIKGRFTKNEVCQNEIWVNSDQYGGGAGMQVSEATDSFMIEGNIFLENAVKQGNGVGGGIGIATNASPIVINNIIAGNLATNGYGGGIVITYNSTVNLVNNTVVNNQAATGGGIVLGGSSIVYLMNTILWANQAPDHAGIYIESGTLQAAYCDIQDGGWSGIGNINTDPLFIDDSFQLSDKSPCLNAGIASFDFGNGMVCYCPGTDITGHTHPDPAGSNPDLGAYEWPLATEVVNFAKIEIPQSYFLKQNYPNPFNPSTTIEFALPKSAFVTLKVYNLLGEEVATLVAEQRAAGIHRINWEARGLASGVYLYRLDTGEFVETRKLILLR